jgi:biopolymer transport protein ExbB
MTHLSRPDSYDPGFRWSALASSRWLRLGLFLVLIVMLASSIANAQDAAGNGGAAGGGGGGEAIAPSPYLLPVQSLLAPEPISWIIVLCSVLAVTLIIQAIMRARRQALLPEESTAEIERLIDAKNYRELIDFTDADDSFVSRSLNLALKRAPSFSEMRESLEAGVSDETAEEFRRLEYINILANIGPLLGLLGTVIGIMDAFLEMQRAGGTADVGALAGGISTALGTTMLGLMLAIPCLVAYSVLRNKVDRLTTEGALLSEEFLLMIKPEKGGSSGSSSRPASSKSGSSPKPPTPRPAKAPARQSAPAPTA